MKRMLSIAIAAAWVACAAAPAGAAEPGVAAGAMTETKASGEVSIVPEPKLVNRQLILKVVALNQSRNPAAFGPQDIQISTAGGRAVPVMSLDALIAQVKGAAGPPSHGSASYNSSYTSGPATSYNQYGQPDVHSFTGSSAPLGGQINPEAPVGNARTDDAAVARQVESLKAGILQDVTIAPGDVKGGEVVAGPVEFHWREKHALRITVRFNGEQYEFDMPAPPAD